MSTSRSCRRRNVRTPARAGGPRALLPAACAVLLLAASALHAAVPPALAIDPRLEAFSPLLGKTWQGALRSPDGRHESVVVRRFDLLEKGRVIRLTKTNRDLGTSGEGLIFWDDIAEDIRVVFVATGGAFLEGTVTAEGNTITLQGTMTWPDTPRTPGAKQRYDFRHTLELRSGTSMRDSWFQNAYGPWRAGHVVDFEAAPPQESSPAAVTPLDVAFPAPPGEGTDRERTLKSVLKVRDVNEKYATGGLYLITQVGDRETLFEKENEELLRHPWIGQPWRFCTIYATKSGDSVVMGRNWDNQNVGSVVVSRYRPAGGYASVSFTRAIDLGFPCNVRLDEMAATPFGDSLLLAPFYAYDGINEKGLFVGVTGVSQVTTSPKPGTRKVFDGYLVRKILDRCRTVGEALELVDGFVPFDLDDHSVNAHFLVADAAGRSVVLEYSGNAWRTTFPSGSWQVLTNKVVSGVPDAVLREKCWRYKTASGELEASGGKLDGMAGMRILRDVSQKGTTWSVVYRPAAAEVLFSVYQDWDRVYRLRFPAE